MRKIIRVFDGWLSKQYGIYPIQNEGECILRVQLTCASHPVQLSTGLLKVGEPVLALHLWNETIPTLPPEGADLGWARKVQHLFIVSLRAVAREILRDPYLAGVRAVQGETVLLSLSSGSRLIRRLGFVILPSSNRLGSFGEFWENFYTWGLMWAFNPVSLRGRHLLAMRREELWMGVESFVQRFSADHAIQEVTVTEGILT